MEKENIKRGIDLQNRLGETGFGYHLQNAFHWWTGGKLNKNSLFLIFIVFSINLFLIYPIFTKNVTPSFSSSALLALANFFEKLGILSKDRFFSTLIIISLSVAPVNYYLFVRKVALRHELIAFLAALFFILPNFFFQNGLPLIGAILNGDGAHALVFSFIPLFFLYAQAFISTGDIAWGAMSVLGTAIIAIISPFAMFNLIILFGIITIAEGFLGSFRVKMFRFIFLLLSSFALSLFWYYPNVVGKIMILSHVNYSIQKLWSAFPILIPVIPVFGALSFLIFDRREKLKPIFVGFSLFFIYLFLFAVSNSLNTTGIFVANRYLVELSFSSSFFLAVLIVLASELIIRDYLLAIKNNIILFITVFISSAFIIFLIILSFIGIFATHKEIETRPIMNAYSSGVGAIERSFGFSDIPSVFADLISLITFIVLIFLIVKLPSRIKKEKLELPIK